MEALKIILLCVVAAIVYGICHDQVTARVCVEYFTIGHPPIFHTDSPTLLAFGWGIIATWWMGLILSIPAVMTSRLGSWPKFDAADLLRPITCLLLVMACASLLAGIAGYLIAKTGGVRLIGPIALQSRGKTRRLPDGFVGPCDGLRSWFLRWAGALRWVLFRRRRLTQSLQ